MISRRSRNLCAGFALALAGATFAGCYSHVTQATGPGAEHYRVHERNTDNIVLGGWFGEGNQSQITPSKD